MSKAQKSNPTKQSAMHKALLNKKRLSGLLTLGLLLGLSGMSSLAPSAQAKTQAAAATTNTEHAAAGLKPIQINNGFAELVKAVKPAVVNISTTNRAKSSRGNTSRFGKRNSPEMEEFLKRFFGDEFFNNAPGSDQEDAQPRTRETHALGSGFIVSADGVVVTNHHVIEGADEIEVVFQDGKRFPATLKGSDKKTDIAVLQIQVDYPLPYVAFGDSDQSEVGDWVIAIGNPFGLGGSVSVGVVSARGRDIQSGPYDDFIQIDAPINRGNSGGPLFNTEGKVIGVNSAIYSPTGGSVGIGFSIPSSLVQNIVAQLDDKGVVDRGWLGVHIQHVTDDIADGLGLSEAYGALVSAVVEDSPAERAGLQAGDVIIRFDDKRVDEMRDLPRLVALTAANSKVSVGIWRNETKRSISVVIGGDESSPTQTKSDAPVSEDALGLALNPLSDELRKKYSVKEGTVGVIITDIDPESHAASRGLRVGDVIKKVGRDLINTVKDVNDAVQTALSANKASLLLLIEREGQVLFVAVPIQ